MRNIAEVDPNFKSQTELSLEDAVFYNVKENPWCLYGLIADDLFRRMPREVAEKVSNGVVTLHTNTSGGRVRFITDSPYVAICAKMPGNSFGSNMAPTGISGFDLYVGKDYMHTFVPPADVTPGYERVCRFAETGEKNVMIHFPLYNNVADLYIGLKKGCSFKEWPYEHPQKIVYYGSSITQGGCASRPGMSYPAQVSAELGCDFVNLGFSGNAKGETVMAEYIAGLNPDIFVMDYDHNAPRPEFLAQTHEPFFKLFRSVHKTTPVVFMSAPDVRFKKPWFERREIVYRTYQNAVNAGDRNVYWIDGAELWGEDWRFCSVDGVHPNDLGLYRMAKKVLPVIQKMIY